MAGGVGVTLLYRALAVGRMAVVAPTTAVCAVMIPVVTDVVLGERLAPLTMLGIALAIGVVARILTSPHDANRQDSHLPMRYDTGRPRAVIRLRISQPRTTSLPSVSN